jgi:hypothetical protein
MSHRVSFWGGLSLSLLMLGGCLLADVGIDEELEQDRTPPPDMAMGGLQGGSGGGSQNGGGSGSASTPAAGSGGRGGTEGNAPVVPPTMGGSGGAGMAGAAGGANLPPANTAGAGGGNGLSMAELVALKCPDNQDLETACAQYCDVYAEACSDFTPAQGGPYDYLNTTECATFCYNAGWAVGTNSTVDSVKCRCYHSVLKIIENAATPHCFHAARVPTLGGCQPMD